jgi:RNA polymerase sigma factor FliA
MARQLELRGAARPAARWLACEPSLLTVRFESVCRRLLRQRGAHEETSLERIVNGSNGGPDLPHGPKARRVRSSEAPPHSHLWAAYRCKPSDRVRNRLVEAYQGLVREIVWRFAMRLPRTVDRGDLETAANVGLMSAIEGFDPERGVRFESYCELRVKGALLDELRSQDWLPRPWRQRLELQKRVLERLRSHKGAEPADEDVASAMEMDPALYRQVFGIALPGAPGGSMPGPERGDDPPPSLDVVADPHGDAPGERLTREELLHLVTQKLTEQEHRILYLKYWEDLPMREIGLLTGLSESRVCKIHARLLERLRDRFRVNVEE